jgi:hypothetical protein
VLAKEMSYKMIYKVFYAKGMFEKYISKKNYFCKLYSPNLKRIILKSYFYFGLCK